MRSYIKTLKRYYRAAITEIESYKIFLCIYIYLSVALAFIVEITL